MLNGKELGAAIGKAIDRKLENGYAKSKAEIARHFKIKPPSLSDWVKKGSIAKDKIPELFRYFSDVVDHKHWGLSRAEWPVGLTRSGTPATTEYSAKEPAGEPYISVSSEEEFLLKAYRTANASGKDALMAVARTILPTPRFGKRTGT